ncbi:DNA primase [Streptomyces rishiriensis]|uniref:Cobalamin biosynthesis protein CobT n=1 Tax=Streptomyces rishiriensis TaxID=68264 RepID=A0ABU0NZ30_STRRH|nr:DNA primase [Streptomyces rishiriensis]MDQ0584391.1 cobalamin biosynthesis protein CobT [Streptomyces rishiriensis]
MNRTALGLAVGAGYFLGRTKKLKLAFAVGSLVAGKRLNLTPKGIADLVSQQLRDNPQFKEIGDQLRQDLRGVGKAASGAMVERQIESLADRLHGRTAEVRDQLDGVVPGRQDADEEEDEEDEAPRDASDEDEDDEPQDAADEDADEDDEDDERDADDEGDEEEPPKKAPAKKTAKKAPAKKAPAKKAPARATAAKKTASAPKTGARTASKAASGTTSRRPKGGDDR